jgi:hypothetical protein
MIAGLAILCRCLLNYGLPKYCQKNLLNPVLLYGGGSFEFESSGGVSKG